MDSNHFLLIEPKYNMQTFHGKLLVRHMSTTDLEFTNFLKVSGGFIYILVNVNQQHSFFWETNLKIGFVDSS